MKSNVYLKKNIVMIQRQTDRDRQTETERQ